MASDTRLVAEAELSMTLGSLGWAVEPGNMSDGLNVLLRETSNKMFLLESVIPPLLFVR